VRGDGRLYKHPRSKFWWCAFYLRGKQIRQSTEHRLTCPPRFCCRSISLSAANQKAGNAPPPRRRIARPVFMRSGAFPPPHASWRGAQSVVEIARAPALRTGTGILAGLSRWPSVMEATMEQTPVHSRQI
jgi:hypothetical protein